MAPSRACAAAAPALQVAWRHVAVRPAAWPNCSDVWLRVGCTLQSAVQTGEQPVSSMSRCLLVVGCGAVGVTASVGGSRQIPSLFNSLLTEQAPWEWRTAPTRCSSFRRSKAWSLPRSNVLVWSLVTESHASGTHRRDGPTGAPPSGSVGMRARARSTSLITCLTFLDKILARPTSVGCGTCARLLPQIMPSACHHHSKYRSTGNVWQTTPKQCLDI